MKSKAKNRGTQGTPNGMSKKAKETDMTNSPKPSLDFPPHEQLNSETSDRPATMSEHTSLSTTVHNHTAAILGSEGQNTSESKSMQHTVPQAISNGMVINDTLSYDRNERRIPMTSMETEYIEALYSDLTGESQKNHSVSLNQLQDPTYVHNPDLEDLPPHSSSESDDIDYEDLDSYEDQGRDGDCEDFDDDLDVYDHDDFLSSQEAILMELRREQVEFEENVRQLQQQLQRQGSLLPLSSNDGADHEQMVRNGNLHTESLDPTSNDSRLRDLRFNNAQTDYRHSAEFQERITHKCNLCKEPRSSLCLGKYGWIWRPMIIEALATAAAVIATVTSQQLEKSNTHRPHRYDEFLPKPQKTSELGKRTAFAFPSFGGRSLQSNSAQKSWDHSSGYQPPPIRHMYRGTTPPSPAMIYPLPPDSPYTFRRKSSEFLEPVGEFHEFQSAEGNSRQVLLHVWPPSNLDTPLLQKLEACCRDFQENDIVRGHSGDGFLNGWRPSWKQPHQTGVLRFGHWRVRAPPSPGGSTRLYPPFQTPLTLAAGGGSVLGPSTNVHGITSNYTASNLNSPQYKNGARPHQQHHHHHHYPGHQHQHQLCEAHDPTIFPKKEHKMVQSVIPESQANTHRHDTNSHTDETTQQNGHQVAPHDLHLESTTQGRLLRLVRAIQMVEKVIIARHLRYLFPTLYEKYHGLQFGTPRLFDAVATVALAMDVSPRLHHDKAHTKHGFCWIVACGDFVGGDLCIPELGKRVVMRPGTVVAIRSTVVAYYVERYARNTSMYTMYAYTSDNNWPPAT
ncbi:hypothetical protein BCR41DRAFT_353471 [Lobosporangium transversale]|uniref:Uncharacterized protein n=1 Tax=Lobosporangium transversale TaxID=64571 RepID=A0A1Y2GMT6_9FUNG|nr:hypothetical protein BCR41DRAFT_353471 [Lobosporangium transversale]ORZ16070.1 hypothetical protein BCR41DRAFT_353471 [Lobosporangium transversale]|eukprot:XP_021881417.1 hypothetical protein BCR41DRAFT_353471 [Lobosporangium transversale]